MLPNMIHCDTLEQKKRKENGPAEWCVTDKNYCLYRRQNEAFIYTLDIFYALGHRRSF